MKILLVDDSNTIASMVTEMLSKQGHIVEVAGDGLMAIEKIKASDTFDVILLDWNMPNMSGVEFLEFNQKNQFTQTPIIMMTTENKPEFIQKALNLGVVEYIMKPFTDDILENKLKVVS